MEGTYGAWYDEFRESMEALGDNDVFEAMDALINASRGTFSFNKKLMEKAIDVSWVEAIENGIVHIDNIIRNPSRTIVDVEEIVPIALSRKTSVESVKHLAQHTDLIQSYDKKTGKITPSKILNVYKEESLATYENKFVNTLVDRLYIFLNTRYEKLAEISKDEEVFSLDFDTSVDDGNGGKMTVEIKIDSSKSLETKNDSGFTVWQRVEKLKKAVEGYKGSELCTTLGNTYVRPPIMRTNAIMKNVDLKACLTLWQYILSYDKVGYEINVEDTAVKPEDEYIEDFYKLLACNMLLLRSYTGKADADFEKLGTKKLKQNPPKIVKKFGRELLTGDYQLHADAVAGFVSEEGEELYVKKIPEDSVQVFDEIARAIEIERAYLAEREAERLAQLAAEEEAERKRREREERLEEKRRIEEAKREERERVKREKEEEEKRIQEMLERRRAEQEAEERERARIEAERQARLEEERRLAEEARLKREEEERIAAEKARIAEAKSSMRSELGDAEGVDTDALDKGKLGEEHAKVYSSVTEEEIEEAKAAMEEAIAEKQAAEFAEKGIGTAESADGEEQHEHENEALESLERDEQDEEEKVSEEKVAAAAQVMDFEEEEDPRTIAAKMKLEQQRKEKERREEERAQRLKAERKIYESKPFDQIRKEYSKNPIYVIPRFIMWLLFVIFGYIPKDTDNPDHKRILAERAEKAKVQEMEKHEREVVEVYYKKYSTDLKYRIPRFFADMKFKRKRKKDAKNKPKPAYTPPKRTAEEQAAIDKQMKALYKEYHVGIIETVRRKLKSMSKKEKERQEKIALGEK